ncbi:sugar ABC transporter permease [Klebsiella pneumoniae]|uniref:sugar ABC transporter permease n=1 Tax=Klebsiella pneumoniae TaxID=573 RepID=UPI000E2AD7D5|nr:sugar ABC transporter permease [Klebsiella pneumoniae]MCY0455130.1 sugar ABC transporter permease [Klebsiella pneumoniae]MEC4416798.1 sugar ABC transporter permease [Klebsiella pneumoniae]MEC4433383.1 sugar ABC transporter permease [Klebsiella pneumoniae]SVX20203.1 maltose transport system permease [Klebsiella pneumoniae]SWB73099.1 maltose transport system permease [Klebsiella pneumoniae]
MKYYYVLALLLGYSSCVLAEECMDNSNIDSLREVFKKNNKKLLIDMSSKEMRRYVESDLLIKNKYSTLVNVSEVYYGWGVDKKSKYPVNTSAVFPNEKVCVWNVSFALPESIRKNVMMMVLMGILLNLRKLMGKQFYITLPLCLILFPTEL